MSFFKRIKGIAKADGMPETLSILIAAQAAHETGNFTSNVFLQNNNAFGYKRYAGAKYQIGAGRISPEGNNYAQYANIDNSVHEITGWIKRRLSEGKFPLLQSIKTPLQYAMALKSCGYYGDSVDNYTKGLERAIRKYLFVVSPKR